MEVIHYSRCRQEQSRYRFSLECLPQFLIIVKAPTKSHGLTPKQYPECSLIAGNKEKQVVPRQYYTYATV